MADSTAANCSGSAPFAISSRKLWFMRGLCLAALGTSVYLAWTSLTMTQVFGCSPGEVIDCGHVLKSKWSHVFGIPVSVPAVALYSSLLVMLGFVGYESSLVLRRAVWAGLTAGALMAGLAAIWFIGLQLFVLHHLCPYCLVVHTCGILLAFMAIRNRVSTWKQKGFVAFGSVGVVALLVAIQMTAPEPQSFVLVRHDDVDYDQAPGDSSGSSEVFAAPGEDVGQGDVFAAPGEIFEAPIESANEPVGPLEPRINEAVKAQSPPAKDVSTLLMIMPFRSLFTRIAVNLVTDENAGDEKSAEKKAADPASDATAPQPAADSSQEKSPPADQSAPGAADEAPRKVRVVTVGGNRITLNVRQWPILGDPDARYIFVEMFDYTCPHCRNTHPAVKGALEKYGDDLAILALPVPLEASCNRRATGGGHHGACELARIAVTVWRVDPSKFEEFHNWLFESQANVATARKRAEALVGAAAFGKEFSSKIPGDYIKRHVDLYEKVGAGSVPKLMFPRATMDGEVNSKSTLVSTIERELVAVVDKKN